MSNYSKTISYLKRNGIKNTCCEIAERIDRIHLEEIQKKAAAYKGSRYFCEEKVRLMYASKKEAGRMQPEKITNKPEFQKDFLFSILVPAYETNPKHLREMLDSVVAQGIFARVELVIADAGKSNQVEQIVKEYQKLLEEGKLTAQAEAAEEKEKEEKDTGGHVAIKYIRLKENRGISENTNAALAQANGDYIGLLDHDDVLASDALFHVRQKLEERDYELLYSDEDKSDGNMKRFFQPHFKPDFNLDYLLTNNYICHFLVMKAELMKRLKFRWEHDGAQDYDLVLRAVGELLFRGAGKEQGKEKIAHIPKVLYHWRCHESSTASNPESKRYAYEAGKHALIDFMQTYMGLDSELASISHSKHLGFYQITYHPTIFQVRPEVAAICGRVVQKGIVTEGPAWSMEEGELSLFTGLKAAYGGYMHRAETAMQVDVMPKGAIFWNKKYQKLFQTMEKEGKRPSAWEKQQIAREKGDIFVYVPDFWEQVNDKLNEDLI